MGRATPEPPAGAMPPEPQADPGRQAAQQAAWRELWRLLLTPPRDEQPAASDPELATVERGDDVAHSP